VRGRGRKSIADHGQDPSISVNTSLSQKRRTRNPCASSQRSRLSSRLEWRRSACWPPSSLITTRLEKQAKSTIYTGRSEPDGGTWLRFMSDDHGGAQYVTPHLTSPIKQGGGIVSDPSKDFLLPGGNYNHHPLSLRERVRVREKQTGRGVQPPPGHKRKSVNSTYSVPTGAGAGASSWPPPSSPPSENSADNTSVLPTGSSITYAASTYSPATLIPAPTVK